MGPVRFRSGTAFSTGLLLALAAGCRDAGEPLPEHVTFAEHIAPIVFEHCTPCHRQGESAPFSFTSYEAVERRAQQIAQVTRSRYMPPWLPEPGEHALAGSRRLTDAQVDLFRRWVKRGAPQGDPALLPPVPQWESGWQLGEPDLVAELPDTFTLAADGTDVFRNFVIPVPLERDRWVEAVELRCGNKRIVHHAIIRVDPTPSSRGFDAREPGPGFGGMEMGDSIPPDGHFLGWTPGRTPRPPERGMAWRLERGTDLVLQLHMLPTGKPESIRPAIGLHFTDRPPERQPFIIALEQPWIDIPPGKRDYVVEDEIELPVPVDLLGLYPHAHYLGKTMEITATLPDGTRDTLLLIDDWDFNWQDEFRYVEPVALPAGSRIAMRYTYDNSSKNERNPSDPPVRVTSGNRSTDEMGTLALQVLPRSDADRVRLEEAQSRHLLAKEPDHFAGHNNLGNALLAQDRIDEALGHLTRATELRPDLGETHYNLGVALATQGRHDRAVAAYRAALAANPFLASAENNLGNALVELGATDEALEHYRRALELRPDFDEAHYNMGNALLTLGRAVEAVPHFREAIRLDPVHAMTHNNLAVALLGAGRPDDALSAFGRAIEIDPALVEARLNLGRALAERNRLEEAIVQLREARRLRPDDPAIQRQLDAVSRRKRR